MEKGIISNDYTVKVLWQSAIAATGVLVQILGPFSFPYPEENPLGLSHQQSAESLLQENSAAKSSNHGGWIAAFG
ncbi:MAG: hypothetical protein V2I51_04705 [Anderseniella sp.]|jgi:hypothetical protein|nr:hypothetical protein [Anderseniella sp.]